MAKTPRFVLTLEVLVEAPSISMAAAQRQAMANMLRTPMLKTLLESAGVKLVGYKVSEEIKPAK